MLARIPFRLQISAVALGIPATLIFDQAASDGVPPDPALFTSTIVLRIFTYVVLFASFRPLADRLAEAPARVRDAATLWFLASVLLGVLTWAWMGRVEHISSPSVKLYSPGALAEFADGAELAIVSLGQEVARFYRWDVVIVAQIMALAAASCLAALYVHWCGKQGLGWLAPLAPIVAAGMLAVYAVLAPWVIDFDSDVFIGDVLVGGLLLNAVFFAPTLVWGGVTAGAVWVSVLALCNLALLYRWRGPLAPLQDSR